MDVDVDDPDLVSLSERMTSHSNETILPSTANPGDIILLADGIRKKYNGSSWRRLCSKLDCSYYSQSKGLCKPHLAIAKKRKSLTSSIDGKSDDESVSTSPVPSERQTPKRGDIITTENGIRKKYDGRQYRRVCTDPTCATIVHGSLEHHHGFCQHHYQEIRAKNFFESKPSLSIPTTTTTSSSVVRKRRRANSPSSSIPTQVPVPFNLQSSIPKSNHRLSIASIPPSVDINNPKKGDIIDMENGSRKKFDGVVWRKICSLPDCFIAAQRNELCRKHFIQLNGKPHQESTMDIFGSMSLVKAEPSLSSESISSIDYNQSTHEPNNSHQQPQENSSLIDGDPFGAQLDHTLINALSSSREKFPTNYLKQWLREHRSHPYPSNQEKLELAKQSSITYDQVTTWFNNARAILRRHQAKLRQSLDTTTNDDDDDDDDDGKDKDECQTDKKKYSSEFNEDISSKIHQSFPLLNGVYCRSIGIQCTPSTANQTTSTTSIEIFDNEDYLSDRRIRILTPSSDILKNLNNIKRRFSEDSTTSKDPIIVITSTCLDDDQMARLKEFCDRFSLPFSDNVDEHTTHLITDEEDGDTLVCPLSKKVIQAIARHMFILTYRWIDACLKINRIINEKPFEIQGDLTLSSDHHGMQRSRQSVGSIANLLLENYTIMLKCDGCQEMLNHEELIELIHLSGAKLITDSHFSRSQTDRIRVVLCEKEYLIPRKDMYEKCLHAGVHFLTPEWFLESLVQYRIQPYQEYQTSP